MLRPTKARINYSAFSDSYILLIMIRLIQLCTVTVALLSQSTAALEKPDAVYERAITHPDRSSQDRSRDASRKPLEILPFIGLVSGMTVLDMGAGGGYTTELAARIVGGNGIVYAQALSVDKDLDNIIALPSHPLYRLPSVAQEADLGAGQADAVLMFFTLHDMYLDNNIDKARLYRDIYTLLKPGGVLVILDNAGVEGSGVRHTCPSATTMSPFPGANMLPAVSTTAARCEAENHEKCAS